MDKTEYFEIDLSDVALTFADEELHEIFAMFKGEIGKQNSRDSSKITTIRKSITEIKILDGKEIVLHPKKAIFRGVFKKSLLTKEVVDEKIVSKVAVLTASREIVEEVDSKVIVKEIGEVAAIVALPTKEVIESKVKFKTFENIEAVHQHIRENKKDYGGR